MNVKKIAAKLLFWKNKDSSEEFEFCTNCDANLTLQKGYDNSLPCWVCKGCGQMLINPYVESDIAWICDNCSAMLNIQPGFSEQCEEWVCTECGYANAINERELYASEEEYEASLRDPYKGLSDADVLTLSYYEDVKPIGSRQDVILVKSRETGNLYVKKFLTTYKRSVYDYLREHPIRHMPAIKELCESSTCLIVIEEYIDGDTISDRIGQRPFPEEEAIRITVDVCRILNKLHNLSTPIIHRDIKPSNIILTPDHEVYLLDMNVAKWYDAAQTDDTDYMGTQNFAAPEQVGYGLHASSAKSDIYAVGMLLNVMLTGDFPKQKRATGPIWDIIERCISLEAEKRYTAEELIRALEQIKDMV